MPGIGTDCRIKFFENLKQDTPYDVDPESRVSRD